MGDMITVGAIDDDRMLLEMLTSWMSAVPDIEVVHTAATVEEYMGLGACDEIVLLDLNLKDDSSPAENVVRLSGLGCKVLVVSIIADQKYVIATLEAGAEGYLTKSHGPARTRHVDPADRCRRTHALTRTRLRGHPGQPACAASAIAPGKPPAELLCARHDTRLGRSQDRSQPAHR